MKLNTITQQQLMQWAEDAQAQAGQGQVIARIDRLAQVNPRLFAAQCLSFRSRAEENQLKAIEPGEPGSSKIHSRAAGHEATRHEAICSQETSAAAATEQRDIQAISVGAINSSFPLMSVIKPFLLLFCLAQYGEAVLDWVGTEASDRPFNSIEQLKLDRGRPRNPMINSGAILLADKLPGQTATDRCQALCHWLNQQSGCDLILDTAMLTAVRCSDRRANYALLKGLADAKTIQNPETSLETYEQICCLSGQVNDLAKLGLLLGGTTTIPAKYRQIVNAVMLTCGLYEASGRYAVKIGLPIKSGISGALLAVVPQQGAIACYSPALDAIGNPVVGLSFVEAISQELQLSTFA